MAATPYCTAAQLATRMSATGVALRTDDDATGDDIAIDEASIEIDGYLRLMYTPAVLATSDWVRKKCVDLATYFLCIRRLNNVPRSVELVYDKAIKDLEKVQSGQMQIADIPMRSAMVPTLSNQRVRLKPFPQVVTEPGRSTGEQGDGYVPHNDRQDWPYYGE